MNLMFRKNFKESKGGSSVKLSLTKTGSRTSKRTNREQGYTPIEEHHYRTHLFFSPPRCTYTVEEAEEPKCGPMTGGEQFVPLTTTSPAFSESDFPQPLVVSFNHGNDVQSHNMENVSRTLTALDRDCFIIPVHSLERFLPAGVPMPKPTSVAPGEKRTQGSLHVMEVPDPKLVVLCHLMSPLEPIDPILESPLSQPILKQRIAAGELVSEIAQAKTSLTGMLLANMERNTEFPFISYYIINSAQTNPVLFYNNLRTASLAKFDPRVTRYTAAHTLDLYSEVASICRPPIHESGTSLTRIHTPYTGYVISVYKVFEGDDREKFERNWLYWTGARMIYRYLPAHAGLKKIALHKSISPKGDKMYILICECSNLLKDVTVCALLLPALRARLTGYTGLFRPIQTF